MATPLRGRLEITLHMFSGRPDPTWVIDEDPVDKDLQFEGLKRHTKTLPGRLGYRGFSVKRIGTTEGTAGRLPGTPSLLSIVDVPHVEQKLLDTSKVISESLNKYVSSCLTPERSTVARMAPIYTGSAAVQKVVDTAIPAPSEMIKTEAPPYEPGKWNNDAHVLLNNNCYNYGNNLITNTFAQPGGGSGHSVKPPYTGLDVRSAAELDGLKAEEESGWNYVALVILPNEDYHWYRLDNTGYWSHKPGQTPVLDTDNSGNKISDPKVCDRGDYTEFVGYMWTRPDKVNIK